MITISSAKVKELKDYQMEQYLHDKINNFYKSGDRKIQLTIKPKFNSSTNSNEKQTTNNKSDNTEVNLEQSMKSRNFVFDYGE